MVFLYLVCPADYQDEKHWGVVFAAASLPVALIRPEEGQLSVRSARSFFCWMGMISVLPDGQLEQISRCVESYLLKLFRNLLALKLKVIVYS